VSASCIRLALYNMFISNLGYMTVKDDTSFQAGDVLDVLPVPAPDINLNTPIAPILACADKSAVVPLSTSTNKVRFGLSWCHRPHLTIIVYLAQEATWGVRRKDGDPQKVEKI
jgi:hypothetical protein